MNGRILDHEEATVLKLTHKEMDKVIRCLRRLTRCRFASGHGNQTWVALPTTVKRLCVWAKAEIPA